MAAKTASDLFYLDMGCYGKFLMKDEMSSLEIDTDKVVKNFPLTSLVLHALL